MYETNLLSQDDIQFLFDPSTLPSTTSPSSIGQLLPRPEYQTNSLRVKNRTKLIPFLHSVFQKETVSYWLNRLDGKGIPMGPVRNLQDAFNCPQTLVRNMVQTIEHPTCGKINVVGPPIKFSRTPCEIRLPPPLLGQHTEDILKELLGFQEEEIDRYRLCGAIREMKRNHE